MGAHEAEERAPAARALHPRRGSPGREATGARGGGTIEGQTLRIGSGHRALGVVFAASAVSGALVTLDWLVPDLFLGYVHLVPLLAVQRYVGRRAAVLFAVAVVIATYFVGSPNAVLHVRLANGALQLVIFLATISGYAVVQGRDAALRDALMRQTAEREFRFLVEAGDALSDLDEERLAARVAELAVPTLGDACVVYRPHGDVIVADAFAAVDAAKRDALRALHRRYPDNSLRPAVVSARNRKVILAQIDERFIAQHAVDDEHARLLRSVGFRSVISVPLIARDRSLGSISLTTFDGRRPFDHTDVALVELYARRAALAIENAELYQREHRVADEYQRASLPVSLPHRDNVAFAAVYEAGRIEAQVGGDWYDAFEVDDGRIVISIGDVAGSGLSAAVTMAAVRQAIRGAARILPDPCAILDAADATVRALAGDRFATAFVAVLDPLDRSVEFAAAGHLTPFLRFPDDRVDRLRAAGLPLGLREPNPDEESAILELPPGTLLVFFTDGIVETTRDVLAGLAELRATLERPEIASAPLPAIALRDALLREPARDDVAILTLRIGLAQVASWRFRSEERDGAQRAKREVVRALLDAGISADEAMQAEMVFGELCGNVARHAGGEVEVLLDLAMPRPVLHVLDRGPGFVYTAVHHPTDVFAESGRGLYIARRFAQALSITQRPGGGSHARAILRAPPRGQYALHVRSSLGSGTTRA